MSVFKRGDRPTWYFQAKTRAGWQQLSTRATNRKLAGEIARAWGIIASKRAWDLLEPVLSRNISIGALYDAFRDSHEDLSGVRQRLADVDVAALLPDFLEHYAASGVTRDTVSHASVALHRLFPNGTPVLASQIDTTWLTARLDGYTGKPATRRKVHSLWSVFFEYATNVKHVFREHPMGHVKRPTIKRSNPAFYDLDTVQRIVAHQPNPERAAYFAILYGTGLEVSVGLTLRRDDIDAALQTVRAQGTKASTRDRVAVIDEWAWEIFWPVAKLTLPMASVFPAQWSRWTVSDWHRQTVEALGLPVSYPLMHARHHWAATHIRAGMSIYAAQQQLGHASPQLTLATYGLFIPSNFDHQRHKEQYRDYESQRISAAGGANGLAR